jgi:hypothetical protein
MIYLIINATAPFYLSSYGMSGLLFLGFTGFFDDCEMK